MKVAISIPDALFEEADRAAEKLGLSRSQLYARAVTKWLAEQRASRVTEALDRVYGEGTARVDEGLDRAQRRALRRTAW